MPDQTEGDPEEADREHLELAQAILETTSHIPLTPIPDAAVARWTAIDEEALVYVPFRRKDIDRLYFAIQALSSATVHFENAMQSWTSGKPDLANIYYEACRRENTRSYDNLARFMQAVMERAVEYEPEG